MEKTKKWLESSDKEAIYKVFEEIKKNTVRLTSDKQDYQNYQLTSHLLISLTGPTP